MENQVPKVIYIMGPPGAGKGTQTMLLAPEIGYEQFSTGDAFRKIAKQDSDLGRRVKETIENGILVPPEMAAEVVIHAIRGSLEAGKGLIFDGTPRTLPEAKMVDEFFAKEGYGRPMVLYLDTDKETMVERNGHRMFCLDVDPDFPIIFKRDERKCVELNGRIGRRADDDPSKFDTRWQQFMEMTKPVVDRYEQEGILHKMEGKHSIAEVHKDIVQLINGLYHTSYSHDFTED